MRLEIDQCDVHPLLCLSQSPPVLHDEARTMSLAQVIDRDSEFEAAASCGHSPLPGGGRFPPPPGDRAFPPSWDTSDGSAFSHEPPRQTDSNASNSGGWRAADQNNNRARNPTATPWLASGDRVSQLRKSGRKLVPGSESFRSALFSCFAQQDLARCSIAIEISLSAFAATELEAGESLWDLVVLAGLSQSAWATTYQDYVRQTWPASSNRIKVLVERLAQPSARHLEEISFSNTRPEFTEHHTCNNAEDDCPPFKLQAERAILPDLIEALAWTSAITTETFAMEPRLAQICVWVTYLNTKEPVIFIGHDEYSPMRMLETSSDCWKRLFPHGMVPGGFPIPTRDEAMKGLELSFDLMCYLCGLEYETSDASGLMLRGHRSLVYPVCKIGDCVQWHFRHLDLADHSKLEEESMSAHLKNESLDELRSATRHFIGLWAKPQITLGTDRVNHASLTWSNLDESREITTKDGIEIGGGIVFPKILNVTLNKTYKIANCQRNVYMVDFEGKLQSLVYFPIILYSPIERRAWLVSYVSVLLHLARARAYHQRSLGYYIPGCKPAADGGSSALQTIMRHRGDPVRKAKPGVYQEHQEHQELGMTVQDYVNEVWAALDKVTLETCKVKRLFRNQIIGYEAADIAKMKTTLRMKRKDLGMFSTNWAPLLSEIKLTLFYEGLFDPILAQPGSIPNTHCCSWVWRQIPKGFDLLTASLPCLTYLSEHLNGSGHIKRLTEEYSWHCPGELQLLFCEKSSPHVCNRLQELKKQDWRHYIILHPRIEELTKYPNGAVVFKDSVNQETIHESLAALTVSPGIEMGSNYHDRGSVSSTLGEPGPGYHQDRQTDDTESTFHEFRMQVQPTLEVRPSRPSPGTDCVVPPAMQLQVWHDLNDQAERGQGWVTTDSERSQLDMYVEAASPTGSSRWGQPVAAARSPRPRSYAPQTGASSGHEDQRPGHSGADVHHVEYFNPRSEYNQARSNEQRYLSPRSSGNSRNMTSRQRQPERTRPNTGFYGRNDNRQLAVPVNSIERYSLSEISDQERPYTSSYISNGQHHQIHHKGRKDRRPRRESKKSASNCFFL
jgi:hypothetical protein